MLFLVNRLVFCRYGHTSVCDNPRTCTEVQHMARWYRGSGPLNIQLTGDNPNHFLEREGTRGGRGIKKVKGRPVLQCINTNEMPLPRRYKTSNICLWPIIGHLEASKEKNLFYGNLAQLLKLSFISVIPINLSSEVLKE